MSKNTIPFFTFMYSNWIPTIMQQNVEDQGVWILCEGSVVDVLGCCGLASWLQRPTAFVIWYQSSQLFYSEAFYFVVWTLRLNYIDIDDI
jgi:hypothetical protein